MSEDQARLIHLIRKIAREEIGEALDEHLCDYEHKEILEEAICPNEKQCDCHYTKTKAMI